MLIRLLIPFAFGGKVIQRIWKIGNEVARGAASFFCIVQVMGKTAWIRGVVLFLLSAGVATSVQRFVYSQDNLKPTIKTPLQEQPQREIESDTWSMRVAGLHDAVLGKEPTKEFLDGLRRVDKQDRDSYFEGLVKTWMQDDAFAEVQATWWLRDHFGVAAERLPDGEGISKTGWDLGLYRDWVKRCIRENLGYRDFVELQLFGERSEKASGDDDPQSQHGLNGIGDRSRIPTAAWYLAGQGAPFSVLESPTAIESNLKGQFQKSLESIELQELKDYRRLVSDSEVASSGLRRWQLRQQVWPTVPKEELVFAWPGETNGSTSLPESNPIAHPLRVHREWTLSAQLRFSRELVESEAYCELFRQEEREAPDPTKKGEVREEVEGNLRNGAGERVVRLGIESGRLVFSLAHDEGVSSLVIRGIEAVPSEQLMHLAIVNDGFGARDSIKIYVNGVQYKTNLAEGSKRCWKEVVRDRPIDWRIFRAKELHWEELQLFRLRLSVPELKGFAEGTGSFDWEEMSEGERLDWVEHYAMRVDPDWRYQRETRGHYAANLAAILESESMLPVLARDVTRVLIEHKERFPLSLLREDWMASGARGAKDSNEQAFFIAMADWRWNEEGDTDRLGRLAKSEIQRSWWGIESSRVAYVQKRFGLKEEPARLKDATEAELIQFFRSNWDREQLIERLLKLSLSSGR